ncbi:MAG: ankyrin repeat domain-containing protein [Rickettsiaceae bacterium]|nr:ankyrin repeat domain-containing protein [Rickettsiaceae bacterium]
MEKFTKFFGRSGFSANQSKTKVSTTTVQNTEQKTPAEEMTDIERLSKIFNHLDARKNIGKWTKAQIGKLHDLNVRFYSETDSNEKQQNINGLTLLNFACINKNLDLVQYLLDLGSNSSTRTIDPNIPDDSGITPLHYLSAIPETKQLIQKLIDLGAEVDAKSYQKETPLYSALNNNCFENAFVLIEHGADLFFCRNIDERLASPINILLDTKRDMSFLVVFLASSALFDSNFHRRFEEYIKQTDAWKIHKFLGSNSNDANRLEEPLFTRYVTYSLIGDSFALTLPDCDNQIPEEFWIHDEINGAIRDQHFLNDQ